MVKRQSRVALPLFLGLCLAVAALVGVPGLMTPASAYPVVSCSVTAPTSAVKPGHRFPVSGKSSAAEKWTVSFNHSVKHFNGKTFKTTFVAPNKPGTYPLRVTCAGTAGTQTQTLMIQVGTSGGGQGHGLPNTGGPSWWWLGIAGAAIVAGGALVTCRRHEPQPRVADSP